MPVHPLANTTDPAPRTLRAQEVIARCEELIRLNSLTAPNRAKIRDIMNGGVAGIRALVGSDVNEDYADLIPAANYMLKACDRMGQKIGKRPDAKVDSPSDDKARAREYADKRAHIIDSFDREVDLPLQLPQVGRWLPGYGVVVWGIKQRINSNGDPYPALELRDPFNAYPGVWTISQQPEDICFRHVLPTETLNRLFPDAAPSLPTASTAALSLPRVNGGVVLGGQVGSDGGWANQSGSGNVVYEYYDRYGCWWVLPTGNILLPYTPNLLSRPAFVVGKRYAFDRLVGQYDQLIGLIAAQARLSMLAVSAAEDVVNTETNIIGDMVAGRYERGKRAVNYLAPGSSVVKQNDRLPFEVFTQIDRLERQTRSMATYPITDDSVSPNSFVTGQGLNELKGSVEDEYTEYRLIMGHALQLADSLRLEWVDKYYPDSSFHMEGFRNGSSFTDTFTPSRHINGSYRTRRVYGAMAGFDDSNKVIVGSVLHDKGVIDTDTFRENVDGLEDHTRIKERIHDERMQEILYTMMMQGAESMDPRIISLIIEELPDGPRKEMFREMLEQEEEPQPDPMAGMAGQGASGAVPDVTTVLNRLTTASNPLAGVQTVSS